MDKLLLNGDNSNPKVVVGFWSAYIFDTLVLASVSGTSYGYIEPSSLYSTDYAAHLFSQQNRLHSQ